MGYFTSARCLLKNVESKLTSFTRREAWIIDVYGILHERPLSIPERQKGSIGA